ncbi:MAG: long-chain fatty acid--CoA ligase [Myxococcales bacterium]|nr:long-chain fatty acid--CoA ligase [Myxococcales bacterium]
MDSLMMEYPLTLAHIFERAGKYFGKVELVSRRPDKTIHRTTYGEFHKRAQKLSNALQRLGVKKGDRVATLAWNHERHMEAYFGIPLMGGVLHTLNPRLSAADLSYIMNHADDRVLLIDDVLLPVWERFKNDVHARHVVVWTHGGPAPAGFLDYEQLIEPELPSFTPQIDDEQQAAGVCYTSGTTGRPKGVVYSHRSQVLHSMSACLPDALGLSMQDVILPVVPMFHVNAWSIPFAAAMVGSKLVFPGPHLDALSVLQLLHDEKVTVAAGVPTVWIAILEALDKEPQRWNLKALRQMVVGGSAAPQAMIEGYQKRHGLHVLHAWGMTEMSPIGTICRIKPSLHSLPEADKFRVHATQGLAVPLVDVRAMAESGEAPWDGKTMGELHVRGPFIARSYFNNPVEADKFTMDGWFRTGDIVTIDPEGYVRITDRSKDLIKSGGEWISSVDLENALMGHPAVKEAAVVAVKHPKWDERPVACVVLREGAKATPEDLTHFLEPMFAKFQLPDAFVFMQAIPRTAAGKFLKSALREQLKDFKLEK